jgi:hypothetical protein
VVSYPANAVIGFSALGTLRGGIDQPISNQLAPGGVNHMVAETL